MNKIFYLLFLFPIHSFGQLNCNYFLITNGDSLCYKACALANEAAQGQGLGISQKKFDQAISLCPKLDYAYSEKAVPYLKRGDFVTWKLLIDKAVELNPLSRLGYRGWCRYQFLGDYQGAIEDLERLEKISTGDIGYSVNGDYHLIIAKALCYRALGKNQVALGIMERQLKQDGYSVLPYDYLHLGILRMETGDIPGAVRALQQEITLNNYLADTYFYLAKAYKLLGDSSKQIENLHTAEQFYINGHKRSDPYTEPIDKVYLSQIRQELETALAKGSK